jgi:hypothetical protein
MLISDIISYELEIASNNYMYDPLINILEAFEKYNIIKGDDVFNTCVNHFNYDNYHKNFSNIVEIGKKIINRGCYYLTLNNINDLETFENKLKEWDDKRYSELCNILKNELLYEKNLKIQDNLLFKDFNDSDSNTNYKINKIIDSSNKNLIKIIERKYKNNTKTFFYVTKYIIEGISRGHDVNYIYNKETPLSTLIILLKEFLEIDKKVKEKSLHDKIDLEYEDFNFRKIDYLIGIIYLINNDAKIYYKKNFWMVNYLKKFLQSYYLYNYANLCDNIHILDLDNNYDNSDYIDYNSDCNDDNSDCNDSIYLSEFNYDEMLDYNDSSYLSEYNDSSYLSELSDDILDLDNEIEKIPDDIIKNIVNIQKDFLKIDEIISNHDIDKINKNNNLGEDIESDEYSLEYE